jgi:hypothetical protein
MTKMEKKQRLGGKYELKTGKRKEKKGRERGNKGRVGGVEGSAKVLARSSAKRRR